MKKPYRNRAYRLDVVAWYDNITDTLQCLECFEWFGSVSQHVVKAHGIKVNEYKQKHHILPKTPLNCKRFIEKRRLDCIKRREAGVFKVFKKGETTIPKKYQNGSEGRKYARYEETRSLIGDGLRGVPKSEKHRKTMSDRRKGVMPPHLIAYVASLKGKPSFNKKYDYCQVEGCDRLHLAKGMCSLHYARRRRANGRI